MARSFQQMLENIRRTDEQLMAAVVEASAYVLHQYHANNRKVDGAGNNLAAQLLNAVPVWLRSPMSGWLQQGKRDASLTQDKAADMSAAKITGFFREQEQKRAAARAKRAAKVAADKTRKGAQDAQHRADVAQELHDEQTIEAEAVVVDVESALVVAGVVSHINAEEAAALQAYLAQLRAPKLAVAA